MRAAILALIRTVDQYNARLAVASAVLDEAVPNQFRMVFAC